MDSIVLEDINVIGFHVEKDKKVAVRILILNLCAIKYSLALRSLKQGENGFAAIFNIFAVILDTALSCRSNGPEQELY